MAIDLDHFHQFAVFRPSGDPQALPLQLRHVVVVDLIAVAMTLMHHRAVIGPRRQGLGVEAAGLLPQAHGAAEVLVGAALLDAAFPIRPFGDQANHRMGRVAFDLRRMGAA